VGEVQPPDDFLSIRGLLHHRVPNVTLQQARLRLVEGEGAPVVRLRLGGVFRNLGAVHPELALRAGDRLEPALVIGLGHPGELMHVADIAVAADIARRVAG
jgi:hypothetical protein